MTNMTQGNKAPDFSLPAHDGTTVTLESLKGAPVVLYFYPKDDTPGCTTEAKDFTALGEAFGHAGAKVLGISRDSVASHCKFVDKYQLTVTLLSDEEGGMCEAYGVWVEKSMYGKKYMGIERTTVLIDRQGNIARIWPKVSVKDHAGDVLAAVQAL